MKYFFRTGFIPDSHCSESPTWGSSARGAAAGIMRALCPHPLHGTEEQLLSFPLPCLPATWDSPNFNMLWWNKFWKWQVVSSQCNCIPYLNCKYADNSLSTTYFRKCLYIFQITVQLFFIMGIHNKGNYMTISSTELSKSPVYHKVCNPSSKDTVWFFDWITYIVAVS